MLWLASFRFEIDVWTCRLGFVTVVTSRSLRSHFDQDYLSFRLWIAATSIPLRFYADSTAVSLNCLSHGFHREFPSPSPWNLHLEFTSRSLRSHFHSTFRSHSEFTIDSLRSPSDLSSSSLPFHFEITPGFRLASVSLRCHVGLTSIRRRTFKQLRLHLMSLRFHFHTICFTSNSLSCHFDFTSL